MSQIAGNGQMNYKPKLSQTSKLLIQTEALYFLHYNISVFVWLKLNLCMLMYLKMTDGVKNCS